MNLTTYERITYEDQVRFILNIQAYFHNKKNTTNVIHHINKLMMKDPMIILMDAEKAFNKILHLFRIKTLSRLRMKENSFNMTKDTYKKPTANIKHNEDLDALL